MAAAGPCALRITCPTDSEGRTLTGAADHLPPPTVRAVAGHHLAPPPQHGSRARDGGGHRGGGGPGKGHSFRSDIKKCLHVLYSSLILNSHNLICLKAK